MKKEHIIIDFMFLYYKYKIMYVNGTGNVRTLTDEKGNDITVMYFVLKEIEKLRKQFSDEETETVVSICFDSPNPDRKGLDDEYKANRKPNRLGESDFENIKNIREILKKCGYNIFIKENTEADDLVFSLVNLLREKFDYTYIISPDLDLAINIGENVGMYRYKSTTGYSLIDIDNFEESVSRELKCNMKYNAVMLYKCTVGDTSDGIKGIFRFGVSKFNKLIDLLEANGFKNWVLMKNPDAVKYLLNVCEGKGIISKNEYEQAYHSLEMVKPIGVEIGVDLNKMSVTSSKEWVQNRNEEFIRLNMKSLVV